MVTSVPGVPLPSSALHLLTTFLVIRLVAVDTGTTAWQGSAVVLQLIIVLSGLTVNHVFNTSCVAGAPSITILPLDSVTMAISPVLLHLDYCNVFKRLFQSSKQ